MGTQCVHYISYSPALLIFPWQYNPGLSNLMSEGIHLKILLSEAVLTPGVGEGFFVENCILLYLGDKFEYHYHMHFCRTTEVQTFICGF